MKALIFSVYQGDGFHKCTYSYSLLDGDEFRNKHVYT